MEQSHYPLTTIIINLCRRVGEVQRKWIRRAGADLPIPTYGCPYDGLLIARSIEGPFTRTMLHAKDKAWIVVYFTLSSYKDQLPYVVRSTELDLE